MESARPDVEGTFTLTCWTFHLSPFAIGDEDVPSGAWANLRQLAGIGVLKEVRHPHQSYLPRSTPLVGFDAFRGMLYGDGFLPGRYEFSSPLPHTFRTNKSPRVQPLTYSVAPTILDTTVWSRELAVLSFPQLGRSSLPGACPDFAPEGMNLGIWAELCRPRGQRAPNRAPGEKYRKLDTLLSTMFFHVGNSVALRAHAEPSHLPPREGKIPHRTGSSQAELVERRPPR